MYQSIFRITDWCCFNPLFVGVWLLNRIAELEGAHDSGFQPFICWSVAFEWSWYMQTLHTAQVSTLYLLECGFWILHTCYIELSWHSFNPLFVGVWLLNSCEYFRDPKATEWFQPFICWSVAFEYRGSLGPYKKRSVSTLYLLECGFWITRRRETDARPKGFNPLFVGVWLLNKRAWWLHFKSWEFQPFICWSVAFEFWSNKWNNEAYSFQPFICWSVAFEYCKIRIYIYK